MNTTLKPGVTWVGAIDWTVRDFHGYRTERGSTYNAYLIEDERPTLIDAVKAPFADELLARVAERLPLERLELVVCNHAEPDHSGALPAVMAACPKATLVCDAKCRDTLARHFDISGWKVQVVATGSQLSIGKRTLSFLETPMVHWPESMFTYVHEERLLFSMDAFGQHYASSGRFDDEEPAHRVMDEARTYFANIVMLYGKPIARVLEQAQGLAIDLIAPSHGIIWRSRIADILAAYRDWVTHKPSAKVVVLYDTMWKSTEKMAHALVEGALAAGAQVRLHHARETHITEMATDVLDAAAIAVGTPTLNKTLMPQVAAMLTYLKGLAPAGKCGMAFGSYGWAPGGARDAEAYLKDMKVDLVREILQARFVPDAADLAACRDAGRLLAERAKAAAKAAGGEA